MKKILCVIAVILGLSVSAFGEERDYNLKALSTFISCFTETGLVNFDMKADDDDDDEGDIDHLGDPDNAGMLVRFGVLHNIIRNYDATVRNCSDEDCSYGPLVMDSSTVAATVRNYFALALSDEELSEDDSDFFSFDDEDRCYHFAKENFNEVIDHRLYHAEVHGVSEEGDYLSVTGDIFDTWEPEYRPGTFVATVWEVGGGWVILDMKTDFTGAKR